MGLQVTSGENMNSGNPMNQGTTPANPNMMMGMNKGGSKKNKGQMNQGKGGNMAQMSNLQQIGANSNVMPMSMNFNEDFGQMGQQSGSNAYFLGENNFGLEGMK